MFLIQKSFKFWHMTSFLSHLLLFILQLNSHLVEIFYILVEFSTFRKILYFLVKMSIFCRIFLIEFSAFRKKFLLFGRIFFFLVKICILLGKIVYFLVEFFTSSFYNLAQNPFTPNKNFTVLSK